MAYNTNNDYNKDWNSINKREFFCKSVNSQIMTDPKIDLEVALDKARRIVDRAFVNYPDNQPLWEKASSPNAPKPKSIRQGGQLHDKTELEDDDKAEKNWREEEDEQIPIINQ